MQLIVGHGGRDVKVGGVDAGQVSLPDRIRVEPEVKLPSIHFDFRLEVDSKLNRLLATILVNIKKN